MIDAGVDWCSTTGIGFYDLQYTVMMYIDEEYIQTKGFSEHVASN